MAKSKKQLGFTVVEIVVVIAVIGILAGISVLGYSSIRDDARNATVETDLRGIGAKMESYYAQTGTYPAATSAALSASNTISVTRDAYPATAYNFLYCLISDGTNKRYAVVGRSASGKGFYFSSVDGFKPTGNWVNSYTSMCPQANISTSDANFSYFWIQSNGVWSTWAK